jgi:GntR family transcriptional regulator, transcriptional repressor for pyruvate dehydrogenase complex
MALQENPPPVEGRPRNGRTPATGAGAVGRQVRVPKTAELVAAQLRRQIVRGDLVEGDALPPEAALMEQFGVSRPTLREAFRVLESEALISVRRGAHGGARVHTPNGEVAARYAALVLEHRGTTLADIFEARDVIEAPCVGMLAARRTDSDIERLRSTLAEAEDVIDEPQRVVKAQAAFHRLVVELAGNQTLIMLSEMLHHIIDLATISQVVAEAGTQASRRMIRKSQRAHEKLLELVEAQQADEAEAMWRQHLAESEEYLLGGPGPKTVLDLLG